MEMIQQIIDEVLSDEQATVLATVVKAENIASPKEGTWIVLKENGEVLGGLRGSFFEEALHKRAKQLFHSGKAETVTYEQQEENGVVHLLLRDIDDAFRKKLGTLQQHLRTKEPVLWIQSMTHLNLYTLSSKNDDPFEFWDEDPEWPWNGAKPFQHIASERKIGDNTYFLQLIWPQPPL